MMTTLLLSCTKEKTEENTYQTFVIEKGSHESEHAIGEAINDSLLEFKVIFDSSAVYQELGDENTEDVNKLYGMSDCGIMHHMNSARVGWRWLHGNLELFAYSYNNGKREMKKIGSFSINTELKCTIACAKGKYIFKVNGQQAETKRTCTNDEHYLLYPYFGGNETAPHRIKIKIARIKRN
ncbi:MAG: hypothetical protein ACO3E1_05105 [Flavobacteriales bacterium]